MHGSTLPLVLELAALVSLIALAIWLSHPPVQHDPAADAARETLRQRKPGRSEVDV